MATASTAYSAFRFSATFSNHDQHEESIYFSEVNFNTHGLYLLAAHVIGQKILASRLSEAALIRVTLFDDVHSPKRSRTMTFSLGGDPPSLRLRCTPFLELDTLDSDFAVDGVIFPDAKLLCVEYNEDLQP